MLRTAQFPEDAGPMAHPVRPDQYLEINNFYTVTVYEKGAEVVRMMQTLVGREGFARGMTLYFQRHDGQAVTCDDFAQAIADANPDSQLAQPAAAVQALVQPGRHAARARPPTHYDAASRHLQPHAVAELPGHAGPAGQGALRHPDRAWACSAPDGRELASGMHVLTQASETLSFPGLQAEPVPSILRGFSAPVILEFDYSDEQLLTLLAHDTDPFNRWEAGQRLAVNRAIGFIRQTACDAARHPAGRAYIEAMRSMLRHPTLDAAFKELVLTLPAETYIAEQLDVVDPQRIHAVREAMREQLAQALYDDWEWAYEAHRESGAYRPDPVSSRPPRAGRPGAHAPVPGGARAAATRCGRARPSSASRTRAT